MQSTFTYSMNKAKEWTLSSMRTGLFWGNKHPKKSKLRSTRLLSQNDMRIW